MYDSYSSLEHRFLEGGRQVVSTFLKPMVILLAALGVPLNAVSISQIIVGAMIVVIIVGYPRLALVLFILTLLLDGLDGTLARYTNRCSSFGALLDQFCDHTREILVIAALTNTGALNPFWRTLYAFAYPALNLTIFLCNYHRTPLPLAIKSYLIVYPALFFYLWRGINWLDEAVAIWVSLTGLVILQGLLHLWQAL
jgi:phosphatidylglycerophosphate synthase